MRGTCSPAFVIWTVIRMKLLVALKILTLGYLLASPAFASEVVTFTDVSGREVTMSTPVTAIALGEGRFLPTLGILDKENPAARVVGMMGEFKRLDPATYAQYLTKFPEIADIPLFGSSGETSFSIEKSLSVRPDVAIFGLSSGHGPNNKSQTILDQFEAAGIPVVIVDFRIDPLVNTPKSIRILGKLMGREKEADEFLAFYEAELKRVSDKVDLIKSRPTVFMESRVGLIPNCCEAIGQVMMGRFIDWAGGVNAYADKIPGTHGMVDREYLLINQPDVYIGTAIGSALTQEKSPQFLALGTGTKEAIARASLQQSMKRSDIAQLKAVKSGKAFAIWHHFYNTPMNVTAVQVIAKWLHPELFKELNPHATLQTYFERFQSVPLDGQYWISAVKE